MKTVVGSVVYKEAIRYLPDFFLSLQRQEDQDFTVLLVNDNIAAEELRELIRRYGQELAERIEIADRNGAGLKPYLLRIELLKAAHERGDVLLVIMDCDDIASENRISRIKEQYDAQYAFFYNEMLDFEKTPVMQELPAVTGRYSDIGEWNYLGMSNTAIYMPALSEQFIDSLCEGDTAIFDWYLYSRLLLAGKTGKKTEGCCTYYRIHEDNLAGRNHYDEAEVEKEIEIKKRHYGLLEKYDAYYGRLLRTYENLDASQAEIHREGNGYWWSLVTSRQAE